MARRRPVTNLLGLAVLSYLSQAPMHPYELSRTMREHGDDRSVRFTHGSIYMVVEQLERAGFVAEDGTVKDGSRPERTIYAITAPGRAELQGWMRDLIAEPQHEYPQFVAALAFIGALSPAEVVELLERRLAALTTLRGEAAGVVRSTSALGVHPLFLVEEEYRIALLDADAAFTRDFMHRIQAPGGWAGDWQAHHQTSGGSDE